MLALRHVEQYGVRGRILYVRRSYKGLADFELVCRELFATVYGTAARYNAAEHVWRFPSGAVLELGQLDNMSDLAKYQGRSFNLLLADEVGQYETPELLDLLRSNLRGPKDIPIRVVFAGNPGGPGHYWLSQRYVFKSAPYTAFHEPNSKRTWVYAPSTFDGNQFIDREQYREQLEAACAGDPELFRAWCNGDWSVARGAYFASVIDEKRNALDPRVWKEVPRDLGWYEAFIGHDFGAAAPSVTYVVLESPGAVGPDDRYYPKGSLLLVDELATHKRNSLNQGLGYTVPVLAERIRDMCRLWRIAPRGVADDAIFAATGHGAGSIAQEFMRCGVQFMPARKAGRVDGWQIMRRLLADAGAPDKPGLYISLACRYWWSTVPFLPHDDRKREDVDTGGPDHGADACRYSCLRIRDQMQAFRLSGF